MSCQVHWEQSTISPAQFPKSAEFRSVVKDFLRNQANVILIINYFGSMNHHFPEFSWTKKIDFYFFLGYWCPNNLIFDAQLCDADPSCTQPDCPRAHCVALVVISRNGMLPLAHARHSVTSLELLPLRRYKASGLAPAHFIPVLFKQKNSHFSIFSLLNLNKMPVECMIPEERLISQWFL